MSSVKSLASCIFCKILKGEIPSKKLFETDYSYAFLDINPLALGHSLVIPKYHGEKLHDVPDEYLSDSMIVAKKIAVALGAENYNILQNNGRIAHQIVDHVHFHVIPKPKDSEDVGLVIGWPQQKVSGDELDTLLNEIKSKI